MVLHQMYRTLSFAAQDRPTLIARLQVIVEPPIAVLDRISSHAAV